MKIYANEAEGIDSGRVMAILYALNRFYMDYNPNRDAVPINSPIRIRAEGGDILIYEVPHES